MRTITRGSGLITRGSGLIARGSGLIRSLWVIRLSALGDVILCEPAVAALARRYPDARITFVTRASYHPLWRNHPVVDRVLTLDEARAHEPPDLAIDLHNRLDTRWLARRGVQSLHWRKRGSRDLWRALWGRPLHRDYRGGPHQVERIATALGLEAGGGTLDAPRVYLGAAERDAAAIRLPDGAAGRVVLLPAASRAVKAWPARHFAAVGRSLVDRGVQVWVAGGPGEGVLLAEVAQGAGAVALPVDLDLGELAAILARAQVVVGNDSGLTHLAAAVGTPVVALFGPTPPGRWGPRGAGRVMSLDPPCGPCSDHGARACQQPRRFCLDDLPVDRVLRATTEALGRS